MTLNSSFIVEPWEVVLRKDAMGLTVITPIYTTEKAKHNKDLIFFLALSENWVAKQIGSYLHIGRNRTSRVTSKICLHRVDAAITF